MTRAAHETFEKLWRAQGLDRLQGSIAFEETVTARTAAEAPLAPEGPAASFTAPPLPQISLGLGGASGDGTSSHPDAAATQDLVVLGTLGEGGMGQVLLARQRSLSRDVAVKVLKPAADDADGAMALLREAVVTGGVEHPNIVPVHALGRDDQGRPVLVMKRVEGTSWRALLRDASHPAWGPLLEAHGDRLTANLEVLMRVADAAHFAHSRGVVHRDIKPENVMVGAFGEVYLVDWGVAVRVGRDRTKPDARGALAIRGTPAFMAPEMLDGDVSRVDARTDVYLLGATLHEALTGATRHQGVNLHAVLYSAFTSRPVEYPPEVPEELAALCNAATHVDPARRPQSALEFRRKLAEFVRHRASLTLSAAASARLAELAAALGGDSARVHRLATECRFGFAQALTVWEGNARAREGHERALRLLLDHEIAHENLDAARALAEELGDATEATRARLDALGDALRARREREADALREAEETDLSRGAGARLPMFALMLGLSVAVNVLARAMGWGPRRVGVASLVAGNVLVLAVLGGGVFLGRRQLLVNRVNRQIGAFVLLCVLSTLAHRLVVLAASPTPAVAPTIAADLTILCALCTLAAVIIRPWFGWMAGVTALGCAATLVAPDRPALWYWLTTNGMLLVGLYFGWARVRRGADSTAR